MHCLCPQAVGFSCGEVVQELGREGSEPRPPSEIDRLGSHTQWPDQTLFGGSFSSVLPTPQSSPTSMPLAMSCLNICAGSGKRGEWVQMPEGWLCVYTWAG